MYDLYRRRRAAPNYDEYNPEDRSDSALAPPNSSIDHPLAAKD